MSKEQRREDLGFLVHFVGDIHQPLHVSYTDDRGGGNGTKVTFFDEDGWNLHRVWDSGLLGRRMRGAWVEHSETLRGDIDEALRTQLQVANTPRELLPST